MKRTGQGGFLIAKIHQLSERIFSRLLKESGIDEINPSQGRILFALWKKNGIPISELSKETELEKSTLTSMLDRLEADGFISRVFSKDDRRKIMIERTEKDKAMQNQYLQVSEKMNEIYYNGFSDSEKDNFEKYLERILANLQNSSK